MSLAGEPASITAALADPPAVDATIPDKAKLRSLYRIKLAEYAKARAAFDSVAGPYWKLVSEKRSKRRAKRASHRPIALDDYVLDQPPLYTGPPKPQDPDKPPSASGAVPVIADFLHNARQEFGFAPETPATEDAYRRAYAKAASAAGLTSEQCVKIYAFESGGDGTYDVEAGREYDRHAPAITTALGYNQLLGTNSVELVAEAGDEILSALRTEAETAQGARQTQLREKIIVLKKMIAFARSVPDRWDAHARLAGTSKGLGVHATILDVDIGPLLQSRKLLTSVEFARRNGYKVPLTAAELEMMNLTGDGSGFDMVLMPGALREKVPTSNFFQQSGYEHNPVARVNNTVARLLAATDAKMESEARLQGAKDLAAVFKEFQ